MQKGEGAEAVPCAGRSNSPPVTGPFSSTGKCCLQGLLLPWARRRWERKAEVENLSKSVFNLKLYYFAGGPILDQTRDYVCEISSGRRSYPSISLLPPCVLKEFHFHRRSIYRSSQIKNGASIRYSIDEKAPFSPSEY